MLIRHTRPEEIDLVMPLYDIARSFMRSTSNEVQWIDGYPDRTQIEEDIALGNHYLCEADGDIAAVFTLIFGNDPTYQYIEGAWLNDNPYGTLHRIASSGKHQGVLGEILQYCFGKTDNLRIDTHKDNAPMLHLMQKYGFTRCGVIYVSNGTPREAFQKTVATSSKQ